MCKHCEIDFGQTSIIEYNGLTYAWFIEHVDINQYTLNILATHAQFSDSIQIQCCPKFGRELKDER